MNTHDELTRSLQQQADRIGGHPIDFESVRGRAKGIRRRRRIAAGAVAAAVLAVAVPVGVTVVGSLNGPNGVEPAPSPEPTLKPAPLNEDGSYRLTLRGAPEGTAPGVPYVLLDNRRLVTPAGSFRLPDHYDQITPYADGWVAVRSGNAGFQVVELTQDFEPRRTVDSASTLAISDDGTRVTWVEIQDGQWTLVNAPVDGGEAARINVPENTRAMAFLSEDRVVITSEAGGGETYGVVSVSGEVSDFDGFVRLNDASEPTGLVAGLTEFDIDGACSGVIDPADGDAPVWTQCDYQLRDFSPDGRYVVGLAMEIAEGSPSVSILDAATGRAVTDYRAPSSGRPFVFVDQVQWEDEDSLLATVVEDDQQAIVRLGLDGTVERVTELLPRNGMSIEVRFAEPRSE